MLRGPEQQDAAQLGLEIGLARLGIGLLLQAALQRERARRMPPGGLEHLEHAARPRAHLPRVKRTDVMGYHAQRLRATLSPWDIKQGRALTRCAGSERSSLCSAAAAAASQLYRSSASSHTRSRSACSAAPADAPSEPSEPSEAHSSARASSFCSAGSSAVIWCRG